MNCPKCRIDTMTKETHEGIEVDRCPSCKGLFLDHGELDALLEKKMGNTADTLFFSSTSDQMDDVAAYCPRCQKDMSVKKSQGDIRIDMCDSCGGNFLDQGELASIQLYNP